MKLSFSHVFPKNTVNAGFSLVEILIALTLLALAGTFVMGKVFDQLHEGRVQSSKIQMSGIAERLKEFRRHCGFYPSSEQGLEALVSKPSGGKECPRYNPNGYLEAVTKDPWDNDYIYESDGKDFNIYSYGNDGAEGGEGEDTDIYLKDKSSSKNKTSSENTSEEVDASTSGEAL